MAQFFKNRHERVNYVAQHLYDLLLDESEEIPSTGGSWQSTETDRAEFRSVVLHKVQQLLGAETRKGDRS